MIRYAIAIAALLLSGCASYSEMQEKTPALQLTTAKTPAAYASCLSPKVMDIWPGMVSVIPDGDGTVVAITSEQGGLMVATFTIIPVDTGSRVDIREMPHTSNAGTYLRAQDAARSCT